MIKRAYIDLELCQQSEDCDAMEYCGKEAIHYDGGMIFVDQECNGCGKCKDHCANKAIKIV
ncbi:hypothetical protein [Selenihalanaerobacter shriftii]|uniref:4Fe-4S ferredoxin-type domain-containing protein n=1 Tax=Selenihalanaerobacter shriftii TaxID=142842 RepID=A0A1T4LTS2_9FIRM|nr:hypothetical protein [Selenihalanaerobacter shriftii]SJZ58031.1 hypothetical protein SAMN02745118_01243 [Selenihalanaerobacter shriftii]